MIAVDSKVRDYIQKNCRTFKARVMYSGSEVDGTLRAMTINKGSCGSANFQPQCIFSNYADITIDNCTDSLTGKKIEIQIGVNIDGSDYWYTDMTGYASKPSKKGNRTTLQVLGGISSKLGKKFIGSGYTTVSSLLSRISDVAGCSITLDSSLSDLPIPDRDLSEYLYKEVLGFVAGLYFGYATETADGDIVIKPFGSTGGTIQAYAYRMNDDPSFYDLATPSGIQVISADNTEYIIGDLQNVSLTNPLMTETAFNTYHSNFTGFTYEPCEIGMTLGDFTIEPWDIITVEDNYGTTHSVRPMSIRHIFDGGIQTYISAPTLDNGEDYSRGETGRNASMAYNALVSGNIGSGGSSAGEVQVFNVNGDDNIINGFGWIDSGGGQAFMTLNMKIPEVLGKFSQSYSGSFTIDKELDLKIYKNYSSVYCYLTLPLFWYDGEEHHSAGGLSISISLNVSDLTYSVGLEFSNDYLFDECGSISVYDSTTKTYKSLVSGTFQANFSWLLNTVS